MAASRCRCACVRVRAVADRQHRSRLSAELVTWSSLSYGRDEGRDEGRLIEARRNLDILAQSRFPGILDSSTIEAITDLSKLETLFRAMAQASTEQQVRETIERTLEQGF